MSVILALRRAAILLRSPKRNTIAAIVDDPSKVQREVRFLFLRAVVFLTIALIVIVLAVFSIRRGVVRIEEQRALQNSLYDRFESMAALSHDVTEGRAALAAIQTLFPKDDNLLPFLRSLETLAKETDNKSSFRFEGTPTDALDKPPYRVVGYTIRLEGSLETFLRYLSAFHQLPYLVVLDGVDLQGGSGIDSAPSSMQLKGRLYARIGYPLGVFIVLCIIILSAFFSYRFFSSMVERMTRLSALEQSAGTTFPMKAYRAIIPRFIPSLRAEKNGGT
jgi:Tfp pilus assembly protein PilO